MNSLFTEEQREYLNSTYVKHTDCEENRTKMFDKIDKMADDTRDMRNFVKDIKKTLQVVGVPVAVSVIIYVIEQIVIKFISMI